ncbi:hypothetical protein [Paenibacillus ehimensis]|uniref:UBC core domain-containing protein n=1 Tax=Paenibacillus ehimensis TaxID=79264 RepID=A0ABT8VC87_9BACL|nr:hypothetical protein [Paenibacillus ehimensis]MDO3678553.1 hypothetical protein [Paenibacillus ehimensis]
MNGQIVWDHFKELQCDFPNISLSYENDRFYVRGEIQFRAQYLNDELVDESYLIELELASSYPNDPPISRELEGRIPNTFHMFPDGMLCLGAPLAVRKTFLENPTLLEFVKTQLIPYFYSFSYKEKNKERMPYGELEHGAKGILTYYKELFQVASADVALMFLYLLAFQKYRGHQPCPCRSGSVLRRCHGSLLLELQSIQTTKEFQYEFKYCFEAIKKERGLQ